MPTPGLVAVTGAASAATVNSQAVTNPASAINQLLLLWAVAQQTPATFTGPAGFSGATASTGNNIESRFFWRVADGTEGGTLTVTAGTARYIALSAIALSIFDPSLFDPSAPSASGALLGTTGTSIPSNDPGTTTKVGDLLVWIGAFRAAATPYPTITVPSGYTVQGSQFNSTGTGAGVGVQAATRVQAAAGPVGAQAGTLSSLNNGGAILVAIPGAPTILPQQARKRMPAYFTRINLPTRSGGVYSR